jgi:hypothetical protein
VRAQKFPKFRYSTPTGDYNKAAHLCPKVCGQDVKRWEDWIFLFAQKHHLHVRNVVIWVVLAHDFFSGSYPIRANRIPAVGTSGVRNDTSALYGSRSSDSLADDQNMAQRHLRYIRRYCCFAV